MDGVSTQVKAVVSPGGDGYVVELSARHGDAVDQRRFDAPRCAALANATALVVAVALRPMVVAGSLAPPPVQSPTPVPSPVPDDAEVEPESEAPPTTPSPDEPTEARAEPLPPERPRRRIRPRVGLGLSLGPGIGVLPSVSAEIRGSVALRLARWNVGVFAMFWTPSSTAVDASVAVPSRIEARMIGGGVRGCHTWSRGRLEIPLCAGLAGGAMRAFGRGAEVLPRVERAPWIAAEAGSGLGLALGPRVSLGLSLDAIAALARPGFDIRMGPSSIAVFRASPLGGRASLGVELRLP